MNNRDLPAMPQTNADNLCHQTGSAVPKHAGLTKREHFAGLAMQGLIAADHECVTDKDDIARYAVEVADALLEELAK